MARDRVYADPDPEQLDPAPGSESEGQAYDELDWLNGPEEKVAQAMADEWLTASRLPETQQREARFRVNELRREGYSGVRLVKDQDRSSWRAWVPMGGRANLDLSNEARRLCRAFVGNLLADPPAPQVIPTDFGAGDRDAADVAERGLEDLQSSRRLNTQQKVRDALDTACTFGSGFIVYTIDPTAGGRIVRTLEASPLAQDPENPLMDPATGMPYVEMVPQLPDPMAPVPPSGVLEPAMVPAGPPPPPVERMVGQDGKSFTEDPQQAAYDWKPDLTSEVLSGRHVRLLPHTATSIKDAKGVMISTWQTWRTVVGMFPELKDLPKEKRDALMAFRPQGSDELIPPGRRGSGHNDGHEARVFVQVMCYKECPDHEDGFYGIAIGGKMVPFRQPWVSYTTGKREALALPVAQFKIFRNGKDDVAGDGLMDELGGVSEVMAAQIGHALHYLDWFNNPTTYVPLHSTIQDADILARKPIIRILPGGEPKTLQPPDYPDMSMAIFELMQQGATRAAMLSEVAQGLESKDVESGRHAYQIVAQAHTQLSEPKQNIEEGYIRCCEIEMQYARAFQLEGEARWTGEDGAYKMRRWMAADLSGDVRVKPGTMTMLSPAAKAQLTEQWMASAIIAPDEGREILASGVGALVGMRDDPWKLEIRRQIAVWEEGPPEGWMPFDPMMAMAEEAQASGADPAMVGEAVATGQLQPPVDPMLEQIWQPRAHHGLPGVAQARVAELAKAMAGRAFAKQPRPWQTLMEQELMRMQMAAMPPMPVGSDGQPGEGGEGPPPSKTDPAGPMPSLDNPALP